MLEVFAAKLGSKSPGHQQCANLLRLVLDTKLTHWHRLLLVFDYPVLTFAHLFVVSFNPL